ncbi:CaiB/BaiF CoA transferase family protein [Burkholderia multivorans]|uniref:CaiB/BaiF CoA transferase family protein n=1 Tax=Burkholderia multivorans TaxID=87883 RepID=UPI000CFEC8FD|nr:CaiB/BaiF CoA-transferase family protein [Burkholderia multivorans]MBY4793217.1 CoA transferase [Burkholderia multivorans]PRE65391.1 CoA transferase [Burkholderia multivorans]PRE78381.1 CoA transferase [Burkholderia multivorans]PRG19398.1 CoA transferase [Burkholderia multivorans]
MTQPLAGLKVLDFSTLLPGPLCSLLLAEAGAELIKFERPERGDDMRAYEPKIDDDSTNFVLLNRGKRSIAIDLKAPDAFERLAPMIDAADVLIEQFRPGVMERLGLGYTALAKRNPRLVYCSITGFGQHGPRAHEAAHDLNYVAATGMLSLTAGVDGRPGLPPALIADVAGGAYPAMMNILLALRQRDQTGQGCHLDVAMADNLFTFLYWGLGSGARGRWPRPASELVTGGSPRYQIYRTADDAFLAAAPIEDKFWSNFVALVGLDAEALARLSPAEATDAVADAIAQRPLADWLDRFAGQDVCTSRVVSLEEACRDPHFVSRGVFDRTVRTTAGSTLPALPVPVAAPFRDPCRDRPSPALGADNALLNR